MEFVIRKSTRAAPVTDIMSFTLDQLSDAYFACISEESRSSLLRKAHPFNVPSMNVNDGGDWQQQMQTTLSLFGRPGVLSSGAMRAEVLASTVRNQVLQDSDASQRRRTVPNGLEAALKQLLRHADPLNLPLPSAKDLSCNCDLLADTLSKLVCEKPKSRDKTRALLEVVAELMLRTPAGFWGVVPTILQAVISTAHTESDNYRFAIAVPVMLMLSTAPLKPAQLDDIAKVCLANRAFSGCGASSATAAFVETVQIDSTLGSSREGWELTLPFPHSKRLTVTVEDSSQSDAEVSVVSNGQRLAMMQSTRPEMSFDVTDAHVRVRGGKRPLRAVVRCEAETTVTCGATHELGVAFGLLLMRCAKSKLQAVTTKADQCGVEALSPREELLPSVDPFLAALLDSSSENLPSIRCRESSRSSVQAFIALACHHLQVKSPDDPRFNEVAAYGCIRSDDISTSEATVDLPQRAMDFIQRFDPAVKGHDLSVPTACERAVELLKTEVEVVLRVVEQRQKNARTLVDVMALLSAATQVDDEFCIDSIKLLSKIFGQKHFLQKVRGSGHSREAEVREAFHSYVKLVFARLRYYQRSLRPHKLMQDHTSGRLALHALSCLGLELHDEDIPVLDQHIMPVLVNLLDVDPDLSRTASFVVEDNEEESVREHIQKLIESVGERSLATLNDFGCFGRELSFGDRQHHNASEIDLEAAGNCFGEILFSDIGGRNGVAVDVVGDKKVLLSIGANGFASVGSSEVSIPTLKDGDRLGLGISGNHLSLWCDLHINDVIVAFFKIPRVRRLQLQVSGNKKSTAKFSPVKPNVQAVSFSGDRLGAPPPMIVAEYIGGTIHEIVKRVSARANSDITSGFLHGVHSLVMTAASATLKSIESTPSPKSDATSRVKESMLISFRSESLKRNFCTLSALRGCGGSDTMELAARALALNVSPELRLSAVGLASALLDSGNQLHGTTELVEVISRLAFQPCPKSARRFAHSGALCEKSSNGNSVTMPAVDGVVRCGALSTEPISAGHPVVFQFDWKDSDEPSAVAAYCGLATRRVLQNSSFLDACGDELMQPQTQAYVLGCTTAPGRSVHPRLRRSELEVHRNNWADSSKNSVFSSGDKITVMVYGDKNSHVLFFRNNMPLGSLFSFSSEEPLFPFVALLSVGVKATFLETKCTDSLRQASQQLFVDMTRHVSTAKEAQDMLCTKLSSGQAEAFECLHAGSKRERKASSPRGTVPGFPSSDAPEATVLEVCLAQALKEVTISKEGVVLHEGFPRGTSALAKLLTPAAPDDLQRRAAELFYALLRTRGHGECDEGLCTESRWCLDKTQKVNSDDSLSGPPTSHFKKWRNPRKFYPTLLHSINSSHPSGEWHDDDSEMKLSIQVDKEGRVTGSGEDVHGDFVLNGWVVDHTLTLSASYAASTVEVTSSTEWACEICTFINDMSNTRCAMCNAPKPGANWTCSQCTYAFNPISLTQCSICGTHNGAATDGGGVGMCCTACGNLKTVSTFSEAKKSGPCDRCSEERIWQPVEDHVAFFVCELSATGDELSGVHRIEGSSNPVRLRINLKDSTAAESGSVRFAPRRNLHRFSSGPDSIDSLGSGLISLAKAGLANVSSEVLLDQPLIDQERLLLKCDDEEALFLKFAAAPPKSIMTIAQSLLERMIDDRLPPTAAKKVAHLVEKLVDMDFTIGAEFFQFAVFALATHTCRGEGDSVEQMQAIADVVRVSKLDEDGVRTQFVPVIQALASSRLRGSEALQLLCRLQGSSPFPHRVPSTVDCFAALVDSVRCITQGAPIPTLSALRDWNRGRLVQLPSTQIRSTGELVAGQLRSSKSLNPQAGGQHYFELRIPTSSPHHRVVVGWGTRQHEQDSAISHVGSDIHSFGYNCKSHLLLLGGERVYAPPLRVEAGDIIGAALDLDGKKACWSLNGVLLEWIEIPTSEVDDLFAFVSANQCPEGVEVRLQNTQFCPTGFSEMGSAELEATSMEAPPKDVAFYRSISHALNDLCWEFAPTTQAIADKLEAHHRTLTSCNGDIRQVIDNKGTAGIAPYVMHLQQITSQIDICRDLLRTRCGDNIEQILGVAKQLELQSGKWALLEKELSSLVQRHRAPVRVEIDKAASIFDQFMSSTPRNDVFRQQTVWSVAFRGDISEDNGGLFRAAMTLLSDEIMNCLVCVGGDPLFKKCDHSTYQTVVPATTNNQRFVPALRWFGRLIGSAFLTGSFVLAVELPRIFWKFLAGEESTIEDVYADCCDSVRGALELDEFLLDNEYFSEIHGCSEFLEERGCLSVEDSAKEAEERRACAKFGITHQYDEAFAAVLEGFANVVPSNIREQSSWEFIKRRTTGAPTLDIPELLGALDMQLVPDEIKSRLVEALESMSDAMRSRFLLFCSGQSRLPLPEKIKVRCGDDPTLFPTAHTCSPISVTLHPYHSAETMLDRLLVSIAHAQEYGFV